MKKSGTEFDVRYVNGSWGIDVGHGSSIHFDEAIMDVPSRSTQEPLRGFIRSAQGIPQEVADLIPGGMLRHLGVSALPALHQPPLGYKRVALFPDGTWSPFNSK